MRLLGRHIGRGHGRWNRVQVKRGGRATCWPWVQVRTPLGSLTIGRTRPLDHPKLVRQR